MDYFRNFPKIKYNSNLIIHAPIRFAFKKLVVDRDYNMWDYRIQDGQTAQYVAHQYYNDTQLDWLIYLANRVIDPYHFWPLSNQDLEKLIIKKYGSLATAQSKWVEHKDEDGIAINEIQYDITKNHTRMSAFEYELEQNNNKREIKLVDSSQADGFVEELNNYLTKESNQLSYFLQYNRNFEFTL